MHLEVEELILAVLLFDAIVLPTPANDSEFDRWKQRGWEPEEQTFRRINLGDMVYEVPWDEQLRAEWSLRWDQMKKVGSESEALAYGLTPNVIAMKAWQDVFQQAQEEGRAVDRPVPVAWYPHGEEPLAQQDLAILTQDRAPRVETAIERDVALLFRREISVPAVTNPDEALDAAVRLASTSEFVNARRAQFDWELKVAGQDIDLDEAIDGLKQAARDYNDKITAFFGSKAMAKRVAKVVVPATATQAAKLTGVPGAGGAAGWGVRRVLARFCPLNDYPDPASVGGALGMVQRRMSALMTDVGAPAAPDQTHPL